MSKKLNYFAILPLYGSIILLLWLFIKMTKNEINKRKFMLYFYCCGLMGGLCVIILMLIILIIKFKLNVVDSVLVGYQIGTYIIGGYLMNLFTFVFINKKWESLKNPQK